MGRPLTARPADPLTWPDALRARQTRQRWARCGAYPWAKSGHRSLCNDGGVATEIDDAAELDEARRSTEDFAGGVAFVASDVPQTLDRHTLIYLLGLADRCADRRDKGAHADVYGIPKERPPGENLHEPVSQLALDGLAEGWGTYERDSRILAAVLHRVSWTLSQSNLPLTHRATDLTRVARWMEEHPHALLSLRCSGLVYSKQNRYVPAWLTFSELRLRLSHYERSYRNRRVDERVVGMFREVQQQALLAETGTAARTVERLLVDWIEQVDPLPDRWRRLRYHEAFNTLRRGTLTGELSSGEVENMETNERKTVTRAAIPSWKRRPGVMTARCFLELATLARVVGAFNIKAHPAEFDSWQAFSEAQLKHFEEYYEKAHSDDSVDFDDEHVRELVQLRLHAALIRPNWRLSVVEQRSNVEVPECLRVATPERDDLARWLRKTGNNANLVLSISAPEYLAWMQIMSGDDGLLDWMIASDQDVLRRDAKEVTVNGEKRRVADERDCSRVAQAITRAREMYADLKARGVSG